MEPDGRGEPGRASRRRSRQWLGRLAIVVGAVLLIPTLIVFAFLDRILFPGQISQGRPEAAVTPPPGSILLDLRTSDGRRVAALFGPALTVDGRPHPDANARPTLLFFYGNGMSLAASLPLFGEFRRLGANVLIPDYLGYGLSDGRPSEAGCYATADACFEHLRARPDVDPSKIVASGWSLGGAVAIDLASRRPVAGLAIFSTITSAADVARAHVPLLIGADWLMTRHRFGSLEKLARISCPILIGHGTRDTLIPFEMMGRLADASRGPVVRVPVDGAGHNDFFLVGRRQVLAELERFLDRLSTAAPPDPSGRG